MDNLANKPQKKAHTLGFAMIIASVAFYFLPDMALVDFLPDIIGYIFLSIGLSRLSYLNDTIDDARKLFFRMILIGAGKLVAILITFSTGSAEEQASLMLLMIFVFALVESFTLIPAYIKLFEGLMYLGTRHDGSAVFAKKKEFDTRNVSERLKRFTVIFIAVKNLCLFLPETAALSTTDNINPNKIAMYEFIPHFRVIGMIVSLVFGIVWCTKAVKYFRSISRDKQFINSLLDRYNTEILPNSKVFAERKIGLACIFFIIASVIAVDFYMNGNNGYNIIPDIMVSVAAFIGILIVKKYIPKKLFSASVSFCAVYAVITSANWKIISDFSYRYTAHHVKTDKEANQMWKFLIGMSALEAVCFIILIALIMFIFIRIINGHTGYIVENYTVDPEVKLAELHTSLKKPLYISFVLALIAAAAGVFRVFMFRHTTELADSSWVIETLLTCVFATVFSIAVARVKEEVREKYMY